MQAGEKLSAFCDMLILMEAETVQHFVIDTQQLKDLQFPSQI